MLHITKSTDIITVEHLIATIYAAPGLGKTSLAFTAHKPLLLDFDDGVYRSANRGDSVQVRNWSDVANITADDLKPYKTLVLDTAGRALDVLSLDIIRENPKMGRSGGSLTLQGFGLLKDRFKAFTNLIRSFGLDIVMLVHVDEQKAGDELIERLDAQGASKGEIYKQSDLMGRLKIVNSKRTLNFNPTDTAFGKNPAGFAPLEVPNPARDPEFLGRVLDEAKATLNRLTAAQTEAAAELAQWREQFEKLDGADGFNKMIATVATEASDPVRVNAGRLLVKVGRDKGLSFDGKAKQFVVKPKEEKAEAAPEEKPAAAKPVKRAAPKKVEKAEEASDVTPEQEAA